MLDQPCSTAKINLLHVDEAWRLALAKPQGNYPRNKRQIPRPTSVAHDVMTLPRCLDSLPVVVLPHEADCFRGGTRSRTATRQRAVPVRRARRRGALRRVGLRTGAMLPSGRRRRLATGGARSPASEVTGALIEAWRCEPSR